MAKRIKMWVSGNPDVKKEAEQDKDGDTRAKGGRVNRKKGGKVEIGYMAGGVVRSRLDRPGRKRGGAVGANTSPLSTAHRVARAAGGGVGADKNPLSTAKPGKASGGSSPNSADTYGGTPAD